MTSLQYVIQVDWTDNNSWADANEDITANVLRAEWRRGKDRPHYLAGQTRSGMARIVLNNDSGIYSPLNTSGALSGNLKPGRKVRIRTSGSGSEATRWQGYIQSIVPTPDVLGVNTVTLTCVGVLGHIGDREVEVAMQTSITVDAAIDLILDEAGALDDYETTILDDSPVGYWRFGESSGNAIDLSGNGNDGTVSGVTQGQTGLLAGDANGSYEWSTLGSNLTMGSPAVLDDIFSGGGTIEALINADTDGESSGRILDKWGASGGWRFVVEQESGGAMKLGFRHAFSTDNGGWETASLVITVDTTHHVAVTYDRDAVGNDPTIYVDGVSVAITEVATPSGTATSDASNDLEIGNNQAHADTFDGHIDEPALYSSTLTAARIAAHYMAGVSQWRDLDTAKTTMNRWWADRMTVTEALRELEETEGGLIYENKYGGISFRHHHDRTTNRTSKATFSDASGAALSYSAIRQADPARSIYNILETEVQLFSNGSADTLLWTYPETAKPSLGPSEARDFWARYPVNDSPTEDVGVNDWTTMAEDTDYDAHDAEDGTTSGVDRSTNLTVTQTEYGESMKINISNGHTARVWLVDGSGNVKLQARGQPVSASDPLPVRQEDTTSQGDHGERTYSARGAWMPNYLDADAWARVNLDLYKAPTPAISITVMGNRSSATLDEVEGRDINERITVRADGDAGLGFNQDWFIEAEHHVVDAHKFHRVTWDLSSVTGYDLYWKLGVSLLGVSTKLART